MNNAPVEKEGRYNSGSDLVAPHSPVKGGPWWEGWDVERDGELSVFR